MKKFLSIILAAVIAVGFTSTAFAALKGDINGDGATTSADALAVLQYSVGQSKTIDKTKADLNKDGSINSADALEILQIAVGKSPAFDVPKNLNDTVSFYCNSLKTVYGRKMTLKYTYTESGTLADLTAKTKEPYNDVTNKTKECENGVYKGTSTKVESVNPGFSFDSKGVASATVTKKADGNYLVKLVLKEEKTDVSKAPEYNTKAAFGFIYTTSNGTVTYTGTTLELTVDNNGNALGLTVKMPYVCEYKETVNSKTHSFKDTGSMDYTATYIY